MTEPDFPGLPEHEAAELIARLKRLPRVTAPDDFSDLVRARIAQDQSESARSDEGLRTPLPVRPGRRIFTMRSAYWGLGAAALVTLVLLKMNPDPSQVVTPIVPEEPTRQLPTTPNPDMKIAATPGTASSSVTSRRDAAVKGTNTFKDGGTTGGERTSVAASAPAAASDQQSHKKIPQELLDGPGSRSETVYGGSFSAVSGGDKSTAQHASVQPMAIAPTDSQSALAMSPFGAFAALKRGLDSAHVRDSLRRAHLKAKHLK